MSVRFSSSRRAFLRTTGLALAGSRLARAAAPPSALDLGTVTPFVDPLPIPTMAQPAGVRPSPEAPRQKVPYYRITSREAHLQIHRDLPPTRMWTFDGSFPGPTIETESGHGVIVEWANQLPAHHFLPIDYTLDGAGPSVPEVRSVVHLHGGRTPPDSDGYPMDWTVPGHSQTCFYPSAQSAALLFYHDHAMGINRLNIYAGLQGLFIVRDPREQPPGLPTGKYEIPLMIADRLLTTDGQLFYPVSPDPKRPWVPEVFGNAILANGKLLPFHEVEPRKYRVRLMNGSNGRFYRLGLSNRASFHVIANDQGLLPEPIATRRLPLAPAERADIIVDFALLAGSTVRLVSDTFDILQFRVATQGGADAGSLPAVLHQPSARLQETDAVRTRRLTLDERLDKVQQSMGMLLNQTPWSAPVTETPELNTVEIWELVNLTEDTHPIHLHLVRFQILDRRPIDTFGYYAKRKLRFTGPAVPPEPFESGWKDTARADPGMVTRIIVPFEGYTGRYVWHCHILEHEDNEMMRPYEVLRPGDVKA
ncbi:MAG TPA: multicopper oxidase domain-containing protein [Acidobacteriaceae bacterium]|jgi:spore coat protein A|nr:multicopper oxidase domain-containing protein [Acidobacteriaceae bacterium]